MSSEKGSSKLDQLTPKQRLFVHEYLVDLNASAAARRSGYSESNADKIGSELLGKTRVSEVISQLQRAREQRVQVTSDMVISELAAIAFADIGQVVRWDEDRMRLHPSESISSDILKSIEQLVVAPTPSGTVIKVKLHGKLRALELLGKHFGAFDPPSVFKNHLFD